MEDTMIEILSLQDTQLRIGKVRSQTGNIDMSKQSRYMLGYRG
jgi:hypothetical protein